MTNDKKLNNALKNLENDEIKLKLIDKGTGDCSFVIFSKNWRTQIGVNDLGFWFEKQNIRK